MNTNNHHVGFTLCITSSDVIVRPWLFFIIVMQLLDVRTLMRIVASPFLYARVC